jgi:hypothetical protein
MNKIYHYLDVDNHQIISEKLYHYVKDYTNILNDKIFWNNLNFDDVMIKIPELDAIFKKINLFGRKISIIYAESGFEGGIHIDHSPLDPEVAPARCLWPIKNCNGSKTKFFDVDKKFITLKYLENQMPYLHIDENGIKGELGSFELNKPLIFNPGIPHGVWTNKEYTEPRLSATIAFHNPPNYLLEM